MDQALIFKPFKNHFELRTELFTLRADKILAERKSGRIPGNIDEEIERCEIALDKLHELMDDYKELKCTNKSLKFMIVYETQINNLSITKISDKYDISETYINKVRKEFKTFCTNN